MSLEQCLEILDLELGASPEAIKEAYYVLVKVWHPDRFQNDPKLQNTAQEKLKQINAAYAEIRSYQRSEAPEDAQTKPNSSRPAEEERERREAETRRNEDARRRRQNEEATRCREEEARQAEGERKRRKKEARQAENERKSREEEARQAEDARMRREEEIRLAEDARKRREAEDLQTKQRIARSNRTALWIAVALTCVVFLILKGPYVISRYLSKSNRSNGNSIRDTTTGSNLTSGGIQYVNIPLIGTFVVRVVNSITINGALALRARELSQDYKGTWLDWKVVVENSYLTDESGFVYTPDISQSRGWTNGSVRPHQYREGTIVFPHFRLRDAKRVTLHFVVAKQLDQLMPTREIIGAITFRPGSGPLESGYKSVSVLHSPAGHLTASQPRISVTRPSTFVINAKGKKLFAEHGCATCHRVGRFGGLAGPELSSIGKNAEWTDAKLTAVIRDPKKTLKSYKMPAYPESTISSRDLADLLAYIHTLRQ